MKLFFYPRLAMDGIRKNRRLYFPYILTCVGMVMMTYILNYLKYTETLEGVAGSDTIRVMMHFGVLVIVFFSALFLFYTNSFLSRRRKKEFGLYNILGMGKRNIGRIVLWETIYVSLIAISFGLLLGIAFSKIAELGVVNLLHGEIAYSLSVSWVGIIFTVIPFCVIFVLLLFNSLRQLWFSNAITLLRSENVGEKPPRANWFVGILGAVFLGIAYYIAVTIKDPISAIVGFVIAVLMVIAATYMLMIAGSVVVCRILQKNKGYYYKPNHFVSVSSMVYRMKRNGAGLASICILSTMVLVIISSTSALLIGGEAVIKSRYPKEINMWFRMQGNREMTEEDTAIFKDTIEGVLEKQGAKITNLVTYRTVHTAGLLNSGNVIYDSTAVNNFNIEQFSDVHQIYMVPVEDYNYMMGSDVTLEPDEVLIYAPRRTFHGDTFGFVGHETYRVKENLKNCFISPDLSMDIVPALMVIVPDVSAADGLVDSMGNDLTYKKWFYSFDTSLGDAEDILLKQELREAFTRLQIDDGLAFNYSVECRAAERQDFYSLYGGLFYLGILLSIVFILAAVLIIYYKQVSEGYEDQARFEIMQKVGMTKRDIKRSVNSQLLTVFFLPLFGAGLHLAFAFPIIEKLLMLFNLNNRRLFVATTAGSFLVFAFFYMAVYKITANAYYKIVSGMEK